MGESQNGRETEDSAHLAVLREYGAHIALGNIPQVNSARPRLLPEVLSNGSRVNMVLSGLLAGVRMTYHQSSAHDNDCVVANVTNFSPKVRLFLDASSPQRPLVTPAIQLGHEIQLFGDGVLNVVPLLRSAYDVDGHIITDRDALEAIHEFTEKPYELPVVQGDGNAYPN